MTAIEEITADRDRWKALASELLAGPNMRTSLNAEIERLITKLEVDYDFRCEGGPLMMCVDWHTIRDAARRSASEG